MICRKPAPGCLLGWWMLSSTLPPELPCRLQLPWKSRSERIVF